MKRFLLYFILCTSISIMSGIFIFGIYRKNITDLVDNNIDVYMLLYGTYNSKDKLDKINLDNYILEVNNNFYEVYVGVSLYLENASKIREIYDKKGNNIYIREKSISNNKFIDYLTNIEVNFNEKNNNEILELEKNIVSKYKELNE